MSIWDDPALKPASSNFVKFEQPGDRVRGTVASISKHTFPDGKAALQVVFAEQDSPTLTAGQVVLSTFLFELRPEPGEVLDVILTRITPRGSKTLKEFFVAVTGTNGQVRTRGELPQQPLQQAAPVQAPAAYAPPSSTGVPAAQQAAPQQQQHMFPEVVPF